MALAQKDVNRPDFFEVLDADDNLVTGLVQGSFTVELWDPTDTEVSGSISVTITELANGNYKTEFTPNAVGHWLLVIKHATYFPYGKREDYHVFAQLFDDINVANLGPGNRAVVITCEVVGTSTPIQGVYVEVWNNARTAKIAFGFTDSNGQIEFALFDGDYKVVLSKIGDYTFTIPEALAVDGDTTQTYDGTVFSPSAPPTADTCVVYGWTHDAQAQPVSVTVEAQLVDPKRFTSSKIQVIRSAVTTSSAVGDGYWELTLTRSGEMTAASVKYAFKIDNLPMGEYEVPDLASEEWVDIADEDAGS